MKMLSKPEARSAVLKKADLDCIIGANDTM
jgi:hypothetical protein